MQDIYNSFNSLAWQPNISSVCFHFQACKIPSFDLDSGVTLCRCCALCLFFCHVSFMKYVRESLFVLKGSEFLFHEQTCICIWPLSVSSPMHMKSAHLNLICKFVFRVQILSRYFVTQMNNAVSMYTVLLYVSFYSYANLEFCLQRKLRGNDP